MFVARRNTQGLPYKQDPFVKHHWAEVAEWFGVQSSWGVFGVKETWNEMILEGE